MTTTINADTVSGGAIITGDASGILGLQAGGNTGLTLNSSRAVGVGATPSFGTAGQVLTSAGSAAAPTWGSAGPIGTDLSYVDYSLTTSSAINSAVSANIYMQSLSLDGTSELMIIYSTSSAHAVVWNSSTNTFGTPILVRTASFAAINNIALAKISSTAVLVCSLANTSTALQTVVLTVSGSTITVGTALSTTLGANSSLITPNTRLVTVGSSYVLNYFTTADSLPKFRAITVSGTTPSIGAELAYAGGTNVAMHHSYAHSASILLHFSMTSSATVFVLPITVSGTTLTAGTEATVSTTDPSYIVTGVLSNSRYALFYLNTTGRGAVVSVAGSVASISTAATTVAVNQWLPVMQVFGNQAFVQNGRQSGTDNTNVITDTSGTATLGTDLANPSLSSFVGYLSTSKVLLASNTDGQTTYYQYGISSGSAVLEKTFQNVTDTTAVTVRSLYYAGYVRPLSGPPQSGSNNTPMLRTSAGKIAVGTSSLLPFTASIDGTYPAKLQQSANPFLAYNDAISEAVVWGIPTSQAASTTTVQLRKVTLA